jgi:hypothetical protein
MNRDSDELETPELPSTEKGPRSPRDQEYTGTGTSRSDDTGVVDATPVAPPTDVDPAIVTGATTSSHPSAADGVEINRSGSGGTGGPATDEPETEGTIS